ncbi:Sensory box histidine kinase [Candidatus Zixiibacteriota bacterium]|nr:Sensory box histidine kinase [candidate division Zixibacteria bacterium]
MVENMSTSNDDKTIRYSADCLVEEAAGKEATETQRLRLNDTGDVLAEMEAVLEKIADGNPRIQSNADATSKSLDDLKAVLEVSLALNSSLVLEDVLQIVMEKAIELLSAERGFIMLLNIKGELQFKTAYNLCKESLMEEDFKISNSIANQVALTGKSVYTSDAQSDERYANQKSVLELHLRSIMCVPLKIKNNVIGIIYLDNSSEAKLFLKSDLYLFELLAQQAAHAIHNANLYNTQSDLKIYNENVINKSPVGITVINSTQNIVSINDAALAIFDKNKDSVILPVDGSESTRFYELVPENERGKWRHMIEMAFSTGQPFEDSRYFHNTGYEEKVLSIKISPIRKLPNSGDGLILIIEDITEKIIMEKYVILSEKLVARGEMAASIGHELNNYLAIIANNAELLSLNLQRNQSEKAGFNARQIIESISKMKRFTDGLMDFSKLEAEMVNYDIKHLIEDLLFSLKAQNRFKKISFSVELGGNLPNVQIDVGQIQQVLMNLLNNAADALDERAKKEEAAGNENFQRKIAIKSEFDEATEILTVTVSDNGCGIPPESLSRIFQPHYTTKDTGHGLGLANCAKIIRNHHGEIKVTSQENKGTSFIITIPRAQSEKIE